VDDSATKSVVAQHRLWSLHQLHFRNGADRYHPAMRVANVNPIDIVDIVTKCRLCLDIYLPRATKHVEVVDVKATQRRLQRIEDIRDLAPESLDLVGMVLEIDLRRVRGVVTKSASELWLSVGRNNQAAQRSRDVGRRLPLQRLQRVLEPA